MAGQIDIIPFTENGRLTGVRLVNFRNDSDEPLASHQLWIEEFFVKAIAKSPNARIRMIGMASRNGDPAYNQRLSKRRIDKVAGIILSKARVNIVERNPRGESAAADDGIEDGDRGGFWRAVLLKWENLSGPAPVPPGPEPTPPLPPKKKPRTKPGIWLITGVDTFGVPIKAGVSAGKIAVTLLNDKAEQWVLTGFGAGVGVGADFGTEKLGKVIGKLAEIGLKVGDIPNIHAMLKDLAFPSATAGGVFRRGNLVSNYSIEEISRSRTMVVTSTMAAFGGGPEFGLITFFPAAFFDPISTAIMFGRIASGSPWGVYSSLGTGKVGVEAGTMSYVVTSVEKAPDD